jgi:hypothetical protein
MAKKGKPESTIPPVGSVVQCGLMPQVIHVKQCLN